ncbi:MAG: hypothetical protein NVSMB39_1610 [Candidatus Saccharimonadales bacterium]
MFKFFFGSPYNISCGDIGNCSNKTPTLDVAFTNAAHLIIGVIGSLAIIFIIYAGIQFALSNGNAKTVQAAKATLTYAVIGLVLALSAYAIVSYVANSIK